MKKELWEREIRLMTREKKLNLPLGIRESNVYFQRFSATRNEHVHRTGVGHQKKAIQALKKKVKLKTN